MKLGLCDQPHRHWRSAVKRIPGTVAAAGDVHHGYVYLSSNAVNTIDEDLQETYDRDCSRAGSINHRRVVINGQGDDGGAAADLATALNARRQ